MAVMFEAYTQRQSVKRTRWLSVSALAHALLLLVMWQAMRGLAPTTAVERPRVTFLSAPPPPPPPGGGQAARPRPPKVIKKPDLVPRKVQPTPIAQPPEPEPADGRAADKAGQAGGAAGGVVGGTVGGVIGEFDGRMTPPRLVSGPIIEYTDKALENDVEGLMIVRCVLSTAGEVRGCEVRQSVRFMDSAVLQTLQKRRYTPVTLAGKPIEVYYTFRIRLTLPR